MGEIPDWLSAAPFPYPKASKSVLEVFAEILGTRIDFSVLDKASDQIEEIIEKIYDKFPLEMKERYDQRKFAIQTKQAAITEEEAKWIAGHIDEFFKKRDEEDGERPI
jgi:hypothetical protein